MAAESLTSLSDYNPDVLSCLANLSNDEVFTPPNIVNDMLDMLPQELFSDPNATFLEMKIARLIQYPPYHSREYALNVA